MSKYINGKQITSISEFGNSDSHMFMVHMGGWKPRTREFLESWQYRLLQKFIERGWVCEAKLKENENE